MEICEALPEGETLDLLIWFSKDWEAENNCWGYRANTPEDIIGNRVFLARENGLVYGYLLGHMSKSENMRSVMPDGTAFFEIEELYVAPDFRSKGVGSALMRFAEERLKGEAAFFMLSTAARNYRAILHFYIEEAGMEFWSARLFKKLE